MRLAPHTVIKVGTKSLTLRPTLRAASILIERHGGFPAMADAIQTGSWTVIRDILSTCSVHSIDAEQTLARIEEAGLGVILAQVSNPIINFLFELAGVERNAPASEANGPKISITEQHRRLFAVATGYLGWSPATAWDSTPAEILEAQKALIEKLRAIHGGKDDKPDIPTVYDEGSLDRDGLEELRVSQ